MFQTTNQIIIYKSPTISNITMENHNFQWVNPL